MMERKFYYTPSPRFEFDSYQEKREFKQKVRRVLRDELGYKFETDFLEDVYRVLYRSGARGLIRLLERRLEIYGGGSNGAGSAP